MSPATAAALPHLTAMLNGLSALLLLTGFVLIRCGERRAHRSVMVAAAVVSAAFLAAYVTHHLTAPVFAFAGQGWVRPVYFTMLASHVALAAVVPSLAVVTMRRGLAGRFGRHRALARWTLPVWLYVSVTGLLVYVMVYHLYPAEA